MNGQSNKTNSQKIEEINNKLDQVMIILPELGVMIKERHENQAFYDRIKKIASFLAAVGAGIATVLGGIWATLNIVGWIGKR